MNMSGSDRLKGRKTLAVSNILDEFEKDDVKKRVDLVDLFTFFGVELKKKGKSHTGICPWHNDNDPSLSVDREKGLYNCFGCGESGDIFTLTEKMKGVDFKEALDFLKTWKFPPGKEYRKRITVASEVKKEEKECKKGDEGDGGDRGDKKEERGFKKEDPHLGPLPEGEGGRGEEDGGEENRDGLTLDHVTDYYHKRLYENKEAREYLERRGFVSPELYARFKIGFADGTLVKKAGEKQKKELIEKGVLNEKGKEHFRNCLTFPVADDMGWVTGIYGRRLESASTKTPSGGARSAGAHLYLKGKHRGVFNRKASRVYDEIILTESFIDALSLIQLGFENVQSLYGTNGFTEEHLAILKDDRVKTVVLAFDSDEAGETAAEKLKEQLLPEGFGVKVINPRLVSSEFRVASYKGEEKSSGAENSKHGTCNPELSLKDWNDYLVKVNDPEKIKEALKNAETYHPETTEKSFSVSKKNGVYVFENHEITYRVSGVKENFVSSLRVNIKAERKEGSDRYYDNLDLYSARGRSGYSRNLGGLFDLEPKRVEKDLVNILEHLEAERDRELLAGAGDEEVTLTEEERALGMEFLTSPDLFDQVVKDMEVLGYVGEELNKQLLYIAASSRKLDDPVSVMIISQSASGKSFLVDTVRELMPPEDVISVTSLSDQALNYVSDLEHKFLILSEAIHNDVVEHQLREMLSAKELSRLVTVKDGKSGRMRTELVKTRAVVSTVMSSTNHNVNPENASRSFVIDTDETREQTIRIHERQREKHSFERYAEKRNLVPGIIKKHIAAQRLLKKRVIVNPFAGYLDFPHTLMRTRRDHERFLDLIACVAFIRQYQKTVHERDGVEFVQCDLDDYRVAYPVMVRGVLSSTMVELPKGAFELYDALREYAAGLSKKKELDVRDITFTQREIRENTGLGHSWIKQNLRLLVEYEFIVRTGKGGRGSRGFYSIKEDTPITMLDLAMVPTPEEVERMIKDNER